MTATPHRDPGHLAAGRPAPASLGLRPELDEVGRRRPVAAWLHDALRATPGWLISMLVHMTILLVLALLRLPQTSADDRYELVVAQPDREEVFEDEPDLPEPPPPLTLFPDAAVNTEVPDEPLTPDLSGPEPVGPWSAPDFDLPDDTSTFLPEGILGDPVNSGTGGEFSGRETLRERLRPNGRRPQTPQDKAIAAGLKWLVAHQFPDGGWSFNHHVAPACQGQCANPGDLGNEGRVAATSLALLPLLGAGQTHKEGQFRPVVRNGLQFLVYRMKISAQGGSLHEPGGNMYSHGLASIVLCEAYAMTGDRGLQDCAQAALNYIAFAQDPVGGGWRYQPHQPGDTSVVGWQLMALKSGQMAYLRVPNATLNKAYVFLDTVQANSGSHYGYTTPGGGAATTAIGLLCRMYFGWQHEDPRLERGVEWLSEKGPAPGAMYYNYYASQVLHHYDGALTGTLWEKWQKAMEDQLVTSQAPDGHAAGSWFAAKGDHGAQRGGRLYVTAMATMILEVPYRYLPIYTKQASEDKFPI